MLRRAGARAVTVCDVGPRDGLQNQKKLVSAADKRQLIKALYGAGVRYVEPTSFVSPKAVPQMADAEEVLPVCLEYSDLVAPVLVMNEKGYDRAAKAGATAFTIVAVCSEGLAMANNRRPAKDTLTTAGSIAALARANGHKFRIALAAAWRCPYDGRVDPEKVVDFAAQAMSYKPDELSITDVIGHADPWEVRSLLTRLCDAHPGVVSAHFHDTQAMGLSNAVAALDAGVRIFDSSVGGIGGCPFAPGAAGNLATEDLVLLLDKLGFETGIDLDKLWQVADTTQDLIGKETGGRTKAWWRSEVQKRAATA